MLRPDDRYASARELADEIESWLADEPVRTRTPIRRGEPRLAGCGIIARSRARAVLLLLLSVSGLLWDDLRVWSARKDADEDFSLAQ